MAVTGGCVITPVEKGILITDLSNGRNVDVLVTPSPPDEIQLAGPGYRDIIYTGSSGETMVFDTIGRTTTSVFPSLIAHALLTAEGGFLVVDKHAEGVYDYIPAFYADGQLITVHSALRIPGGVWGLSAVTTIECAHGTTLVIYQMSSVFPVTPSIVVTIPISGEATMELIIDSNGCFNNLVHADSGKDVVVVNGEPV